MRAILACLVFLAAACATSRPRPQTEPPPCRMDETRWDEPCTLAP